VLLGLTGIKASHRHVGEIDPWRYVGSIDFHWILLNFQKFLMESTSLVKISSSKITFKTNVIKFQVFGLEGDVSPVVVVAITTTEMR